MTQYHLFSKSFCFLFVCVVVDGCVIFRRGWEVFAVVVVVLGEGLLLFVCLFVVLFLVFLTFLSYNSNITIRKML